MVCPHARSISPHRLNTSNVTDWSWKLTSSSPVLFRNFWIWCVIVLNLVNLSVNLLYKCNHIRIIIVYIFVQCIHVLGQFAIYQPFGCTRGLRARVGRPQTSSSPQYFLLLAVPRLFTWLSLVVSMVMSFCAVLFSTRCLG